MARHFTKASSEHIYMNMGSVGVFGPSTVAVICQKATDAALQFLVASGTGADPANWIVYLNTDDTLGLWNGFVDRFSTYTVKVSEGWVLVAVGKSTGTATPRFHKYVYSTDTWTHQDTTGGTAANSGTPATRTAIGSGTTASSPLDGDIAAIGIWGSNLSDAQVENLPFQFTNWQPVAAQALWVLDQSAVGQSLNDITGNGATQNAIVGTTIATSSVPVFNYADGVWAARSSAPAAAGLTADQSTLRVIDSISNKTAVI